MNVDKKLFGRFKLIRENNKIFSDGNYQCPVCKSDQQHIISKTDFILFRCKSCGNMWNTET